MTTEVFQNDGVWVAKILETGDQETGITRSNAIGALTSSMVARATIRPLASGGFEAEFLGLSGDGPTQQEARAALQNLLLVAFPS